MGKTILSISNRHVESCGNPPVIEHNANTYIGYFQNMLGEQWILVHNRETGNTTVRGGDAGWDHSFGGY
jgi:hypothetical protein